MAKNKEPRDVGAFDGRKQIEEERKQLKKEQKAQKKEAKKRARELAKRENELDDDEEGGGIATFFTTLFIVALWIVVICVVIKMDVGGFGSSVLAPILKDVPVVNKILPGTSVTETADGEGYGGYTGLKEAVDQITYLEKQLEISQTSNKDKDAEIEILKAEVLRLQPFEEKQVEFQRIRTEFYEEVIYAENGPGEEAYIEYFESMDPTTAEYLYKQVIIQREESKEIQDYAATYSQMKPKAAAAIFENMQNDLPLVADILNAMNAESRGAIMGVMDPEVAAKLTKIMNPES